MKAHYYIEKDMISGNGIRYLFIPEKKVVISIGPIFGELIITDPLQGHFQTQDKVIDYAQKIIQNNGDTSNDFMQVEYKGKIKLPEQYVKEIDNILLKYESLRISEKDAKKESEIKSKKLEQLAKEQFPD